MAFTPSTQIQIPDHSILDQFNKQCYLGNQYVQASNETIGTSETAQILITCPVQSGVASQKSVFVNLKKLNCYTGTSTALLNFYLSPTVSANGTAAPIYNLRPASINTPIALAYTGPTITSNGNFIGAISTSSYGGTESSATLTILDPGQSLLVTAKASGASTTISITLSWYEL